MVLTWSSIFFKLESGLLLYCSVEFVENFLEIVLLFYFPE